ncbi:MAG: 2OG-Fe(II) oxygenase, partial [Alphaproteobacteria bacterium]|nr:2OG-Fe(II) oxygenase [Alphaproteobacteria bacterium]
VLAIYRDEPETQVDRALKLVQALAADTQPKPAERQAPVLIVPDVLTPVDCKRLITIYNMDGNVFVEPGHGVQNQKSDYKMRIPEYGRKDRIDHWVVNQKTQALINDRLQRRLFPEIYKAFHYRVTKHERYRIGCYEGERGGELHGHRDNVQANVAHRRFACSINLNAEDFEGGELAFPEFGAQRFSPATGEAVVFSSSLLHEPLHVTKGRRLVLLAFLFGET